MGAYQAAQYLEGKTDGFIRERIADVFAAQDRARAEYLQRELERLTCACGAGLRDDNVRGTCLRFSCRKAAARKAGPVALAVFQAKAAAYHADYAARKARGAVYAPGKAPRRKATP